MLSRTVDSGKIDALHEVSTAGSVFSSDDMGDFIDWAAATVFPHTHTTLLAAFNLSTGPQINRHHLSPLEFSGLLEGIAGGGLPSRRSRIVFRALGLCVSEVVREPARA